MASPEVNVAALGSSGSGGELSAFESLSGVLRGWKKKVNTKKTGALKRKDVSYLSPNGEEIKSRHQLLQYLKAHPGILKPGDFCWTSAGPPRRSLRLNRKGRHIRFEELDLLPTKRRKRNNSNENNTEPTKPGRGRPKSAGTSQKPEMTGTEEPMLAVKLEPVEEAEHVTEPPSIPTLQPIVLATPVLQPEEAEEHKVNNSYQDLNNPELNLEEKRQEKEHTLLTEDVNRDNMEEDLPSAATDEQAEIGLSPAAEEVVAIVEDIPVNEEQTIAAESEKANGLLIAKEGDETMEEETSIISAPDAIATKTIAAKLDNVGNPETDEIHVGSPEAEGNFLCGRVPDLDDQMMEEPADHQVVASALLVNVEDSTIVDQILKEDILNFISESEPLDHHHQEVSKANGMDVDAFVKDTIISLEVRELGADVKCKPVDSPQPQGIHALVDDLLAFGGKAKPLEYEVTSQTSLENMVAQTMMEPVSVLE